MPELPEVEVASRLLRSWLSGRRILSASARASRVLRGQPPRKLAELRGHRLEKIERFGKWMLLSFDGGEGLVSHLGMTGKWVRRRSSESADPYTRATLELSDGFALDYRDPRMFGLLVRGKTAALRALPNLLALGPDPLAGIDVDRLHESITRTQRSLKEVLMDQRTLAGLGNIQVAESLHRAGLDPRRPGRTLTRAEAQALSRAIDESLRATLGVEDTPEPVTYIEEGGDNTFLVYDREGQPCFRCGKSIRRIVQGGRSTFFCPRCQPARRSAARGGGERKRARAGRKHA